MSYQQNKPATSTVPLSAQLLDESAVSDAELDEEVAVALIKAQMERRAVWYVSINVLQWLSLRQVALCCIGDLKYDNTTDFCISLETIVSVPPLYSVYIAHHRCPHKFCYFYHLLLFLSALSFSHCYFVAMSPCSI